MDGGYFQVLAQLCLDCRHLISVWCNDPDALIPLSRQIWEYLLPNHVDLSLIQVTSGMVARRCPIHGQDIRLFMVLCHDDELPTVEFLVAEIDDFGMAAIVFPQENRGSLRPCGNGRGEQTVGREMVDLRERIPRPDRLAVLEVFAVQHIGKLLEISHNDDITSTCKGEYTCG